MEGVDGQAGCAEGQHHERDVHDPCEYEQHFKDDRVRRNAGGIAQGIQDVCGIHDQRFFLSATVDDG